MPWKRIFSPEVTELKFQKVNPKPLLQGPLNYREIQVQPWRALAVKARALAGEVQDPVTWDGDAWEDPTEPENSLISVSQGCISPGGGVSLPSAADAPNPTPEILPFLSLRKSILLLSQQGLSLKEMPGKTILMSLRATNSYTYNYVARPITRREAEQAPGGRKCSL